MNNCAIFPKSHFFTQNVITDIDIMLLIPYTNLRFWGHFGRFLLLVTKNDVWTRMSSFPKRRIPEWSALIGMNNGAVCCKSDFFTQNVVTDITLMLPITYTNLRFWGHLGRFSLSVMKNHVGTRMSSFDKRRIPEWSALKGMNNCAVCCKSDFLPKMSLPTSPTCYPSLILTFDFGVILGDFHFQWQKMMFELECQVLTNDVYQNDQH